MKDLRGAAPEAVAEVDALKPYRGGSDDLWRLHKLNNIDKHRLLIAVGSAYRSFDFSAIMQRDFSKMTAGPSGIEKLAGIKVPRIFLTPADRLFPLKVGDRLFMDLPDAGVSDEMEFRFEVAFGEPEANLNGDPLVETLERLMAMVETTTTRFERFLRRDH